MGRPDDFDVTVAETTKQLPKFIGLTVDEANELASRLGLTFRYWTSQNPILTADLHPRRITAFVRDGAVIKADAS